MCEKDPGQSLLENAYLLETPNDNIAYYGRLADSYDTEFASSLGYALPKIIADRFATLHTERDNPVIDIGCGTGLIGEQLTIPGLVLDGLDISQAMLDIAKQKQCYRNLFTADLTKPLKFDMAQYAVVLSSGTFTHGHLGPDALLRVLDKASDNTLFVLSINKEHHRQLGFDLAINELMKEKRIRDLETDESHIYTEIDHDHGNDQGVIVSFRKV